VFSKLFEMGLHADQFHGSREREFAAAQPDWKGQIVVFDVPLKGFDVRECNCSIFQLRNATPSSIYTPHIASSRRTLVVYRK
jgi:hypothetical protein